MEKYYQITSAIRRGDNIEEVAYSRDSAINKIGRVLLERDMQVQDIYYKDDPHKHNEVLKCEDGSLFFVDRIMVNN